MNRHREALYITDVCVNLKWMDLRYYSNHGNP